MNINSKATWLQVALLFMVKSNTPKLVKKMGHATFNPALKESKKKDGTRAIRIRITKDQVHAYYNTGLSLKGEPKKKDARKGDWNPEGTFLKGNWVRSSHHDHAHYNSTIKQAIVDLQRIATKKPHLTAAQIKQEHLDNISGKEEAPTAKKGFLSFYREWIRRKRNNGQAGTAYGYETTLGYVLSFKGESTNEPETLTPSFGSELVAYLIKEGYAPSTINLTLTNCRTVFNKAVLEGWLPPLQNPFDLQPVLDREKEMERPTKEQLLSLMTIEIPKRWRMAPHARNVFLMQYFLHGARFNEAALLRWEDVHETHISYWPSKRAKNQKHVPRHAGIDWVLNQYKREGKYIFPYMKEADDQLEADAFQYRLRQANRSVNLSLDKLSELAGLPISLRTHMQRHTFADNVWDLTRDMRKLQEMLGHSSITSTQKYTARLKRHVIDEVSDALYGGVGKQEGNNRETMSAQGGENDTKKVNKK